MLRLMAYLGRFGAFTSLRVTTNKGALSKGLAAALIMVFAGSTAMAEAVLTPEQWTCVDQYTEHVNAKIKLKVPEKHLPRLFIPDGTPKDTVVIFTHGMFESPYFFKGINSTFQEQGYISLSILLPGHWEGDWSSAKNVSFRDWMKEINTNIKMAQCFGKKIIFAGHSAGGLLSIWAALSHPEITEALMLWAPAVDLRALPSVGMAIGGFLHLNGNIVMGSANLDETPLYSPHASKQIQKLIDYTANKFGGGNMVNVYRKITVPTFLAYAEKDPAIDTDELTRAAHAIAGIKDVMYFPKNTLVHHGNITKFPGDAYQKKTGDYNLKWGTMQIRVVKFLRGFVN
ncbi:alpha/beta hydrolase [Bdellovibrio sp. HCB2-146]|uniref:alpha/beta hydrolase n=1 Tax=Bdellovibrio sp. HCB2-146 TaxID=3394362 RepID=UPI0039BCF103